MLRNINENTEIVNITSGSTQYFMNTTSGCASPLVSRGLWGGAVSRVVPPYVILRSDPQYHVVVFMVEGELRFNGPGGPFTVKPGQVMVGPAHVPQHYSMDTDAVFYWFHFLDVPRWDNLMGEPRVMPAPYSATLFGLVEDMLREMALCNAGGGDDRVASTYAELVGLILDRGLGKSVVNDDYNLSFLWGAVEGNLSHNWTIEGLAGLIHVSPASLYRLVKGSTGKTPLEVVAGLRMKRAEHYLRATGKAVGDIGYELGYGSPYAFSRAFSRIMGMSPTGFRNLCRKDRKEGGTP